jgi:hypothetical protein
MLTDFGNLTRGLKMTEIPGHIACPVVDVVEAVELK